MPSAGDVSVTQRLRSARVLARREPVAAPQVVWHREVATDAVVLELRAADAAGLLYRVTRALDEAGAEVRAARISTLGADVVDAFYLVGAVVRRAAAGSGRRRGPGRGVTGSGGAAVTAARQERAAHRRPVYAPVTLTVDGASRSAPDSARRNLTKRDVASCLTP